MAYSQKSIIDASLRIATMTGGDANASPVIDSTVVIEDLFYDALRRAVVEGARIEAEAGSLKREYSLSVASGTVALPDTVIEECLDQSSIHSTSDEAITDLTSFQPRYFDYLRPVHSQLGYYTVQGSNLLYRQAGQAVGAYTGTLLLVAIGTPDIPASITGAITIGTETAERCIVILANLVRGGAQ